MVLDDAGAIGFMSPAAIRRLGAACAGRPLVDLAHPDDRRALEAVLAERTGDVACRLAEPSGAWRRMALALTDCRDHQAIGGVVCLAHDVDVHAEVAAQLIHQATHDTLTALPNRAHLLDRLDALRSERPYPSAALLYIDLDGFKSVNDTLGHAAGDRVLVAVADRLRRAVRPEDTVARLGGDEFVVIALGVGDREVALDIAERIIAGVRRPVAVGGRLVDVSASVGIAIGSGRNGGELLDDADRAMYRAKHDGRNRATLYRDDLRAPDADRARIEAMLRSALDGGGVTVVYQPIVDLGTGRVHATEAMLRVRRSDGRLSASSEFLGVAEETGLSVAVGAGLVDHACAQMAEWQRGSAAPPTLMSVPVTGRQLRVRRAASQIDAVLGAHGLAPSALCLQVPERCLVEADSAVSRTVEELKGTGVRLAVDDFGGGRAGLAYLRRFGIDVLRIDPTLMGGLGHDGGDTEVVRSIVGLGQALGIATVARGVETADQAELLTSIGCPLAQGLWFAHPSSADEALHPTRRH